MASFLQSLPALNWSHACSNADGCNRGTEAGAGAVCVLYIDELCCQRTCSLSFRFCTRVGIVKADDLPLAIVHVAAFTSAVATHVRKMSIGTTIVAGSMVVVLIIITTTIATLIISINTPYRSCLSTSASSLSRSSYQPLSPRPLS